MILNDGKEDLTRYLENKKFKKIFILSGKNSYYKSGANKILNPKIKNKETKFFKKTIFPVSMN